MYIMLHIPFVPNCRSSCPPSTIIRSDGEPELRTTITACVNGAVEIASPGHASTGASAIHARKASALALAARVAIDSCVTIAHYATVAELGIAIYSDAITRIT